MQAYQSMSEVEFWSRFTDSNGNRMSITTIDQVLRDDRETTTAALAQEARNRYSLQRFNELFSYIKSGKKRVKSKDAEIAKTYQQLQRDRILE